MKIAVVGSGVAGVAAASELHSKGHDVEIFEKKDHFGGHVRTVHLPVGNESFPVELGVFMHDPVELHPLMGSYIKKFAIETREFPLTFSYETPRSYLNWSSANAWPGPLRKASIFFNNLHVRYLSENTSFFMELNRFVKAMPEIKVNQKYNDFTVIDFLAYEGYSETFLDIWLYPQLHCWWGITRDRLAESSIQVIVDSMESVSRMPQYIFVKGWEEFLAKLSEPIKSKIHTESSVEAVKRSGEKVHLSCKGKTLEFDALIFATPPNIVLDLLDKPSADECRIFKGFDTITTKVFLHNDASWMPKCEKWALANLIQDERGSFTTLWYGDLHKEKPPIFITWGDHLKEKPSQIILEEDFIRTLPNISYSHKCKEIRNIQGKGNVYYCGAHVDALASVNKTAVPSLWHENAFRSGLEAANFIQGK